MAGRVALVIGNGAYSHAMTLDNAANDAEAMAALLTRLGFEVVKGINLDQRAMGDVQATFETALRAKPDVALLFYAGHGLQVRGKNHLIPIDAEITELAHLASRALLFNDVLEPMSEEAGASLIFLDACRDSPFTRNLARTLGEVSRSQDVRGGLARVDKVAGTFIAYATAPDRVAFDGKGKNSPFTGALLTHIETPGLSVGDMMIDVRNSVLEETGGRQEPWDQSSLRSRFYFVAKAEAPVVPNKMLEAAAEWNAIKETDSLATLTVFRDRFTEPPWSIYADIRRDELRQRDKTRRRLMDEIAELGVASKPQLEDSEAETAEDMENAVAANRASPIILVDSKPEVKSTDESTKTQFPDDEITINVDQSASKKPSLWFLMNCDLVIALLIPIIAIWESWKTVTPNPSTDPTIIRADNTPTKSIPLDAPGHPIEADKKTSTDGGIPDLGVPGISLGEPDTAPSNPATSFKRQVSIRV